MSLVNVAEVTPLINSALSNNQLQTVIDRVEVDLTEVIGDPYDGTAITERIEGGQANIYTKRKISSVSSITEYSSLTDTTGSSLTENTHFFVWGDQGRIQRIGGGYYPTAPSAQDVFFMSDSEFATGRVSGGWGPYVDVTYIPVDQRSRRKQVIIDLVRIYLSRTGLKSESLSGAYSFTAPDNWEAEIRRVAKKLQFTVV